MLWRGGDTGCSSRRFCISRSMANVWLRRLSDVREVARELLRLVGAESDELRGGMTGRPTWRPLSSFFCGLAAIESDMVRL